MDKRYINSLFYLISKSPFEDLIMLPSLCVLNLRGVVIVLIHRSRVLIVLNVMNVKALDINFQSSVFFLKSMLTMG